MMYVVEEVSPFFRRNTPQSHPIGVLPVQVTIMEAVVLGLARNALRFRVVRGEGSLLDVVLELHDPGRDLVCHGQQQACA